MKPPPPTMPAMASATPEPSTIGVASMPFEAEHALEGERHQDVEQQAQQARIEDGLERVRAGFLNSLV